jgi:dipeptidyl aminopeptidase/acylaminoacyl peptidase
MNLSLASVGRYLRVFLLFAAGGTILALAALAVWGMPAPPGIMTENAPRVSWKWAWKSVGLVKRMQGSRRFAAWLPHGRGILVHVGSLGVVHIVDHPGAEPRRLPGLPERARMLVQSRIADTPYFLFSLDQGGSELYTHYRFDLERGEYAPLTAAPARSYLGDLSGRQIVYASTRRNREDFDLYVMDVMDPASDTRVFEADGEYWPAASSPDGKSVLVGRSMSHTSSRVYLFDLGTRRMRELFHEFGGVVGLWDAEWSRDGRTVYLATELDREFVGAHALDPTSGRIRALTADLNWDVDGLELMADERTLALLVNDDGRRSLHLLDIPSGRLQRVEGAPEGHITRIISHPSAPLIALDIVSQLGVTGVWSYDVRSSRFEPWAVERSDTPALPAPLTVRYPTFDSQDDGTPRKIPAIVFPAATEFTGPRPVAIDIHGGPAMQATTAGMPHFEFIRRQGATVIAPNVRGSRGYGKTYAALDDKQRREDAVRDIGALLDWIATQPSLDSRRVVVSGGSYGGYLTLASLIHDGDRISCGFNLFGISDFVTFLEASQEQHYPESQRAEFGDERNPAERAFLESISPARRAERIRVPLLVFQGANDVRVKPRESRQMVERIRREGGTVTYVEAANEGHGMEHPLNQLYVGALALEFIDGCLVRVAGNAR